MISKTESGRVGYREKYRVAGRVRVPAGHWLRPLTGIIHRYKKIFQSQMLNVRKMPKMASMAPDAPLYPSLMAKIQKFCTFFKNLYHFPKVIEPMQQLERVIL